MRKTSAIFILSLLVLVFLFGARLSVPMKAYAATVTGLKTKISNIQSSQSALERQIKKYQNKIADINGQQSTLQNSIASIDANVDQVATQINLTQSKIQATKLTIQKLQLGIEKDQNKIDASKSVIANNIRHLDHTDQLGLVEILLKNDNMSDFWRALNALSHFQKGLQTEIANLVEVKNSALQKQATQKGQHQELLGYKTTLAGQQEVLQDTKSKKTYLLKKTEHSESNYQALLNEQLKRKKAFDEQLEELQSKLHVVLHPGDIPNKGSILSWPVIGPVTQRFGYTASAKHLYSSSWHSGMDIGVPIGTPVKAAADGVVKGVGNTDLTCRGASYGKFVFIKYDNGLASIYGHLSVIQASLGERVARGQVVGLSGETGYATGPHVHFGLYVAKAVKMASFVSKGCPGAVYHMPIAPHDMYLGALDYLPPDPYYQ